MAFNLFSDKVRQNLTAWLHVTEETFCWYFVYEDLAGLDRLLWRLDYVYGEGSIRHHTRLPATAIPVLKAFPDGTLMRLWAPPGPRLARDATIMDEGLFTLLERCYTLIDET